MADVLESIIVATDVCAMITILPIMPYKILYGVDDQFTLLHYTFLIQILIIYAMFISIALKWLFELNESTRAMINNTFFMKYFGLSFVAMYLFFGGLLLIFVPQRFDLLIPFLLIQIPFAEADMLLAEQPSYKKRHTLPILLFIIIVLPMLGSGEIVSRLVDDTNCVDTLEIMVNFHKYTCLSVFLTAMGLATLKKPLAFEILFPTDIPPSRIKAFGDCAICAPVIFFWMIIITSVLCSVNLWFPMLMHQLMHDAAYLLIDEISHWHLEAQDDGEEFAEHVALDTFEEQLIFLDAQGIVNDG